MSYAIACDNLSDCVSVVCLVGLKRKDGLVKGVVIRHHVREDILQAGQSGHDVKDVERRR